MSSLYADEIRRIKDLLELMGRGSKKSLGQNFLVNSGKISDIVSALERLNPQQVVEVGPGLGALTLSLKEKFPNLTLIEMDNQFAQYWRDQGCHVVHDDALQVDWSQLKLQNAALISNLPYQIGARLVVDRSVDPQGLNVMVLMFQKEVAKRITAKHDTGDYSLISVISQAFWQVNTLTELGPNDYFPPPQVASRVVVFKRKAVEPLQNAVGFLKFIKLSFSQKRKFLKKSLLTAVDEPKLEAVFAELGVDLKVRPEDVTVDTYIELYKKLMGDRL